MLSQISPHKGECNQFTRQISLHKVLQKESVTNLLDKSPDTKCYKSPSTSTYVPKLCKVRNGFKFEITPVAHSLATTTIIIEQSKEKDGQRL